jgi:hypothetical protein
MLFGPLSSPFHPKADPRLLPALEENFDTKTIMNSSSRVYCVPVTSRGGRNRS